MQHAPGLPDDHELIERLLARDETAYKQAVMAYHGLMVHIARAIVGDAVAEEVAQDAWLSIIKALPKFEGRSSFKTWIISIVANSAKSRLRRDSRLVHLEDLAHDSDSLLPAGRFDARGHWQIPPRTWETDDPEALLASEQLQDCLEKTLERLPHLQQAIVSLRDNQGLEMNEICNLLDVSESNARVLLHRARTRLRNTIERYNEDGTC